MPPVPVITSERRNLARSVKTTPRVAAEINAELDDLEQQEKDATKILAVCTV